MSAANKEFELAGIQLVHLRKFSEVTGNPDLISEIGMLVRLKCAKNQITLPAPTTDMY